MINNAETRGPAFEEQSSDYPWPGKVPVRIRMTMTVRQDGWWPNMQAGARLIARGGEEYEAWTNKFGAVAAYVNGERLGVKPDEFEVVEFCEVQAR